MRLNKRIRLIIIIAIVVVVAICIVVVARRQSKKITDTEWFLSQQEYIEQFEALADETDDVTALYIAENMGEDDFLTHVELLRSELAIMKAAYEQEKDEVDIKNGTQTVVSQKGTEAIPACFEAFSNLYDAMEASSGDTTTLAYVYLAYGQEMTDAVNNYETSLNLLYLDEYGEELYSDTDTEGSGH